MSVQKRKRRGTASKPSQKSTTASKKKAWAQLKSKKKTSRVVKAVLKSTAKKKAEKKMELNEATNIIKELRELCEKQDKQLKDLKESPLQTATVGYVHEDFVFLGSGGNFMRLLKPTFEVEVGDVVLLTASGQILEKCIKIPSAGTITTVKNIIDGIFCEIDGQGHDYRVLIGKFGPNPSWKEGDLVPVQKGDRVVLDAGRSVIMENLGRKESVFAPESIPNVRWYDIGGLEEAKLLMREAIEYPHKYKEAYAAYGKKTCKGVLLWGAPGCGKTLMGKAAARELAEIYGSVGAETGFMYIKGPEILNKYVGASEGAVRRIFTQARLHKEKNGYPCVVFIDEADAILGKRGSHGSSLSSTLVPMFLTEMDGLEESAALIILATNRQDVLDPAVVRDGRIDRKIKITRPNKESALQIVLLNLRTIPLKGDKNKTAAEVVDEVYSDKRKLFRFEAEDDNYFMRLRDTVNGAMLAGIVDYATTFALRRDIENKSKDFGVVLSDFMEAIDRIDHQARDLNQEDNITEFLEANGLDAEKVVKKKAKPRMATQVSALLEGDDELEAA